MWCIQLVVKNVKDAKASLQFLRICKCHCCIKIWLQEKLTFIHITYLMPFKTSNGNSSKCKTINGLKSAKSKLSTFNDFQWSAGARSYRYMLSNKIPSIGTLRMRTGTRTTTAQKDHTSGSFSTFLCGSLGFCFLTLAIANRKMIVFPWS